MADNDLSARLDRLEQLLGLQRMNVSADAEGGRGFANSGVSDHCGNSTFSNHCAVMRAEPEVAPQ
ncbi:hypothetical protein [Jiangella alba]|uniref:Uncharacterized protein n=1 Tax=Jiangella alba TaxID=561176 RepID=A0A1H5MWS4_9ACTN|nr:hypothetical protein [Jiangella alba]SEE93792.1 hypothetical protein SAMN04488561_3496 [Jiangella alba]